jgi:hypothetical protein
LRIEDTDYDHCIQTVEDYNDCDDDDRSSIAYDSYERSIRYEAQAKDLKKQNSKTNNRLGSATSVYSTIEDENFESSRLTTGDTGYTSTLDMSMSSMSSLTNMKESLAKSSAQSLQKPVIITGSHGAATSKAQLTSLKQLKNNISPLSNIKYVKHS